MKQIIFFSTFLYFEYNIYLVAVVYIRDRCRLWRYEQEKKLLPYHKNIIIKAIITVITNNLK